MTTVDFAFSSALWKKQNVLLPIASSPRQRTSTNLGNPFWDSEAVSKTISIALNVNANLDALAYYDSDTQTWAVDVVFADGRLGVIAVQPQDKNAFYVEVFEGKTLYRTRFNDTNTILDFLFKRAAQY